MNLRKMTLAAAAFGMLFSFNASAMPTQSFQDWLKDIRQEALNSGISQQTVNEAFDGLTENQRVIELDQKQPETGGKWTFADYQKRVVSQTRINRGREMMQRYKTELEAVEQKYGVPAEYIVALWGIETNFGSNTGDFDLIRSLATLTWEGRRADFFEKQLMAALRIIDEGHISREDIKGSWAGAMGQNQFMPTSWEAYAADGDGDGKKDIWNNISDVFASTANYLSKSGWHAGERWGREVVLPQGFNANLEGLKTQKSLSEWRSMGITKPNGDPIPVVSGMNASVVAPDGIGGPTYLVYNNYRTIMRWNRSTYFATSVGLLANAIAQP